MADASTTTADGRPARRGLTRRGWAIGIIGVVALAVGLVGGGDGWQRVGLLLLALLGLSALAVVRTRVGLAVTRSVDPGRVPVDQEATVTLDVASSTFVPAGMLRLEDTVPGAGHSRPRFVIDRGGPRYRRRITYRLRPRHRGLLTIGPLRVFVEDPFGLVTATRELAEPTALVVTPMVAPLPSVAIPGEWSGSGESRPRSIAAAGEEDVTVRPYQRGDDRRRVHWRASAHHAQLMVRREEQPWQSRATLVLDARATAHSVPVPGRQNPTTSSWEFSVAAAASIGTHLLQRGYSVRLVTDAGAATSTAWHDRSEGWGTAEGVLLEALATVSSTDAASIGGIRAMLHGAGTSSGLLVAVLASLSADEAATLARLRHETSAALAVLVDVDTWPGGSAPSRRTLPVHTAAATLRGAGWHPMVVDAEAPDLDGLARSWALMRDSGPMVGRTEAGAPIVAAADGGGEVA
jgi:uncharacterized protein (DUF58 family)